MWVLDTNVISEMRKARPHGGVVTWMRRQAPTSLFIAAATIGEIQTGIERARVGNPIKADEIESWLESFVHEDRILPATAPIFRLWAKLMHGRTGDLSMDAMIAATALVHGLSVATRNTRDFDALGVATLNPFEG